jgi:hypothetical protein
MSIPYKNLSDNKTIQGYVNATDAQLKIMSVPTQRQIWFPAFLTDFSQTFDATWNTEDVFGRMDPIATYQGTKRTMSLGFDLPAGSLQEAKDNLEGCSELVKMVYPIYNSQGILSKPPLVRIQFANLIKGNVETKTVITPATGQIGPRRTTEEENTQKLGADPFGRLQIPEQQTTQTQSLYGLLGWISGLSWKPNLDMGMFTDSGELYPKIIGMSFSFNILHEETLNQEAIGSFPFGGK